MALDFISGSIANYIEIKNEGDEIWWTLKAVQGILFLGACLWYGLSWKTIAIAVILANVTDAAAFGIAKLSRQEIFKIAVITSMGRLAWWIYGLFTKEKEMGIIYGV